MIRLGVAALIGAALLAQGTKSPETSGFLCIPDYSTGFAVGRSGKWESTNFDVKGERYLLRLKGGRWYWTRFGEEPMERIDSCTDFNEEGFSECNNREEPVRFNRNTLRFQVVHPYGYVVSDLSMDKDPITPYYMIGRCTPL